MMDNGHKLELDIINCLNQKKYIELTDHWKSITKRIFPSIEESDLIHAYLFFDKKAKPDIVLSYKHYAQRISIKCGRNPTVHMENYNCFMRMLRLNNVSQKTLNTFELYHFGKNPYISNNGNAYTREEILIRFGKLLEDANIEINNNSNLIRSVIHRAVIKGYNNANDEIDFLYYGSTVKGFLLSKDDIYRMICNDKKKNDGALHFGGLIYQPGGRDEERIDRYYSKLKWPILAVKFYVPDII